MKFPTGTEKRAAVIFANQNYKDIRFKLYKTHNDADDMKAVLDGLGFDVIMIKKDITQVEFNRDVYALREKLRGYDVACFYYSGHGAEYNGSNYLIPVDIELEYNVDIQSKGVPVTTLYDAFTDAGIKTAITVLDACRTLPVGKGLPPGMIVPRNNPSGTFTMYATRAGKIARENLKGRNSFFTQELIKYIGQPNLSLDDIYYRTRQAVKMVTGGEQEPTVANELDGQFVMITTEIQAPGSSEVARSGIELYERSSFAAALPLLKEAAEAGNADAQAFLGRMYLLGEGVGKSVQLGFEWCSKSAARGNAFGQTFLAIFYLDEQKNYPRALELATQSADQLNAYGQNLMGNIYQLGAGVEKDDSKGAKFYRMSANQGNRVGQNNLASCYRNGTGLEKDIRKAIELYEASAAKGFHAAMVTLGNMYRFGKEIPKDEKLAAGWYQKAAELNDAEGQFRLGQCYEQGIGVTKNETTAFDYYLKAATQELPTGRISVGNCYRIGVGVKKDLAQALKWYRMAADQKDTDAYTSLGFCYYNGLGVASDPVEAVKWFRMAADAGHPTGQANLGVCFRKGQGVKKDLDEAIKYFRLGNDQDDPFARYQLALCYERGEGVEKDMDQAIRLYTRAADQGDESAKAALKRLGRTQ